MREMGRSMMQSMMQEWNAAPLSPEARVQIMAEVMKLFGGGRRQLPQTVPGGDKKSGTDPPAKKNNPAS
jgi:hypothetical protein